MKPMSADAGAGLPARHITDDGTYKEMVSLSEDKPVLLFKHSSTCPISGAAMDELKGLLSGKAGGPGDAEVGYLIVQDQRPISNQVAEDMQVRHESPQALVLRRGKAVWHASHGAVTAESMAAALKDAAEA